MPFFLPFALGGLALAALGLKRVLEGQSPRSAFPEGTGAHAAWQRHQQALSTLRATRQRVNALALRYSERQERARLDTVEPFRALLARLERWEHASAAQVLTPGGHAALQALPEGPAPRATRQAWAVLGVGTPASSSLAAVLTWLEKGWLSEEEPPVVVDGVSLFAAASEGSATGPEAAQALEAAREGLGRVVAFLEALHTRLSALDARVATLHGRASVQLAYLDPASFDEDPAEPRERLLRLGHLMSALAEALRQPALEPNGALAPLPEPLAE
ncbi:MAG TPA: hypothetical protein VK539_14665 [Myxococcaceae bacterium]|nr:hypothetical protein [Myxococcaceae bacterium]